MCTSSAGLRTFSNSFFFAEADADAPVGMLKVLVDISPVCWNGSDVDPAVEVAPVSEHADGMVPSKSPRLSSWMVK